MIATQPKWKDRGVKAHVGGGKKQSWKTNHSADCHLDVLPAPGPLPRDQTNDWGKREWTGWRKKGGRMDCGRTCMAEHEITCEQPWAVWHESRAIECGAWHHTSDVNHHHHCRHYRTVPRWGARLQPRTKWYITGAMLVPRLVPQGLSGWPCG